MYIKKKYKIFVSLIIIIAIFINAAAFFPVKKTNAAEGALLFLYKSGEDLGEYTSLEDAFLAMTDKNGEYKIVFNQNTTEYMFPEETELPEVSSITLSGIYEFHNTGENTADINVTTITTSNDICLNSDLILDNIKICNINRKKDSTFKMRGYTLEIQGEYGSILSEYGINKFNLSGEKDSCLIIDGIDFYYNSNITVNTLILKNGALLGCNGDFNQIQELFSYGLESIYYNRIFFNHDSYYGGYSSIGNIQVYKDLNILTSQCGRLDIGQIRQYTDKDILSIFSVYDDFREDLYFHININGDTNVILSINFYINNLSQKGYNTLRNTSILYAPDVPASKIIYTFDCEDHREWKAGKVYKDIEGNIWLEPASGIESVPLCYKLDEESRDSQGIYYSLDEENKTATTGKDSDLLNSTNYKSANKGNIIIPSYVEKYGIKYTVTRIGANSFSGNYYIGKVEIPDTVKSIGPKAFSGIELDEIYIGSGVEDIGTDAFNVYMLCRIYVNPANQNFFSQNNVLFDKKCETLIKFPCADLLLMRNYSVPYPVKTIAEGAFRNSFVKQVILADSVKVIEKEAFSLCNRLESFSGKQIGEIQEKAFYRCENLKYFNAGTDLKSVSQKVFYKCNSLEWLFLPDSVVKIADEAFCSMSNLKYFIGAKNAEYGARAFLDCENLLLVQVSEYMENIPDGLFYGCISLEKLYITEQYKGCEISAFAGNMDRQCTVYGTEEQKKFITKAQAAFENQEGHIHTMVTEMLAEPCEKFCGAEVMYCTYCHYIQAVKWLKETGSQDIIPSISPGVIKTPAPSAIETQFPTETPAGSTKEPEVPSETAVPSKTPVASSPPGGSTTGGGGSSGGGGGQASGGRTSGGAGASGGGGSPSGGGSASGGGSSLSATDKPEATQTPLPELSADNNIPDTNVTMPQTTPEAETPSPAGNNSQTGQEGQETVSAAPSSRPVPDNAGVQLKVSSFSLKLNKDNQPCLRWKKNPDVSGYIIYRSAERSRNYTKIYTIKNPEKNIYTDKKVFPGRKYYYRICAYKFIGKIKHTGKYSNIKNIKTLYLITPQITASKGKTPNKVKYVQINLRKYSGTDIAIYLLGSNKKYKRLNLIESSIKKYNASFKLRYNSKKKICCLKVKTFLRRDGKKYYSGFSNIVKIRM